MERFLSLELGRLCFLISKPLHKISNSSVSISIPPMKHEFSTGFLEKDDPSAMDTKASEKAATEELSKVLLDPPTNCCMSGCSNCVWITYAENLAKLSIDGGSQAKKMIEQNVNDPCLKAFLLTELRMRQHQS